MPLTLSSSRDKAPILDLIRKVLIEFLFPGTTPEFRENALNNLEWFKAQKDPMFVSTRMEFVPELKMLRLTTEISFTPTKKETAQ